MNWGDGAVVSHPGVPSHDPLPHRRPRRDVELFGRSKLDWLSTFLELPHGAYGRVFARLAPEALERGFRRWPRGCRAR